MSFAGKGNSGASFGFMQGDLSAKQAIVTSTFKSILAAEAFTPDEVTAYSKKFSVPMISNPLTKAETDRINSALQRQSALVDAMDSKILADVYKDLDGCFSQAATSHRSIEGKASLYMALWINMTGYPDKLLIWIGGGDPNLEQPVPGPGAVITAAQMETYLRATHYYRANPGNFPHMLEAVAVGAALLPGAAAPNLAGSAANANFAVLAAVPSAIPSGDCLVYEQATGRMLVSTSGGLDTLAVGYSGSLSKHGVNDPDRQCEKGIGPIPRGIYTIGAPGPGPSPYSLRLTPDPKNDMCGRGDFLIHGDSTAHPGDASDGCIILKLSERHAIVSTGIKKLVVVSRISA